MAVFDYVEQDRTLLRVKGHQKKIVEDEQLTSFDFLELGLKIVLDFCDLELSEQFGGVGIQGAYATFASLMSQCAGEEAFTCA